MVIKKLKIDMDERKLNKIFTTMKNHNSPSSPVSDFGISPPVAVSHKTSPRIVRRRTRIVATFRGNQFRRPGTLGSRRQNLGPERGQSWCVIVQRRCTIGLQLQRQGSRSVPTLTVVQERPSLRCRSTAEAASGRNIFDEGSRWGLMRVLGRYSHQGWLAWWHVLFWEVLLFDVTYTLYHFYLFTF